MNAHVPPSQPDAPFPRAPYPRGGAAVGLMAELPPLEQLAIAYLRAWCEGGRARAGIGDEFAHFLGGDDGLEAAEAFDGLMRAMMTRARRPLIRHGLDCRCVGGDEAAFAQMVAAGIEGERDEAALFAALLVEGAAAFDVVLRIEGLRPALVKLSRLAMQAARANHEAKAATRH